MRFRRPLLVEWRGDFHVIKLHVQPVYQRHIPNVQKLIAARECGFEFAKRIALNVAQLNVEMNELRLAGRRLHGHIPLTDDVGEIRVVARVGTESQPQGRVSRQLLGGTRRPNADAHRALVGQETIQPNLPFVVARQLHVDLGGGLHLPGRRGVQRTVHPAGKGNAHAGFPVQQM